MSSKRHKQVAELERLLEFKTCQNKYKAEDANERVERKEMSLKKEKFAYKTEKRRSKQSGKCRRHKVLR